MYFDGRGKQMIFRILFLTCFQSISQKLPLWDKTQTN